MVKLQFAAELIFLAMVAFCWKEGGFNRQQVCCLYFVTVAHLLILLFYSRHERARAKQVRDWLAERRRERTINVYEAPTPMVEVPTVIDRTIN